MFEPLPLPFTTTELYAGAQGLRRRELDAPSTVSLGDALVQPQADAGFYPAGSGSFDVPELTRTEIPDVVVRGCSNLLTTPSAILRHEMIDMARHVLPEHLLRELGCAADGSTATWASYDPFYAYYLPEAAAFTDNTAANYAHWLTEVLPRIAALVADGGPRTPMLLDLDLHPNLSRTVQLIAGDWPTYRLAKGHLARVGRLHHVSVAGYVPYKLREGQPIEEIVHGRFSPVAMQRMVRMLRAGVRTKPSGGRPKWFVRRNSGVRRLVNEDEIQAALVARGFQVIEPERLTVEEQVAAYSEASMVVGATGAAMANLIFCRPDCPIVVLMPRFAQTAYWYWRHMSAAAGAGPVVHVSGPQVKVLADPWHPMALHQDFRVEAKDVLAGVDQALALTR